MKKFGLLLAAFVGFLLAVFVVLMIFPPLGLGQRLVASSVRSATGGELTFAGRSSLQFGPTVTLNLSDVAFSAPPAGGTERTFVKVRAAQLSTSLMAAASGDRRIDRVVLTGPVIDVELAEDGSLVGLPAPAATRREGSPQGRLSARDISVGTLEIVDGTITYRDRRTGLVTRLQQASGTLRDVRLDSFAQAVIKAAAATVESPADVGRLEIAGLDTKLGDFGAGRFRSVDGAGAGIKWVLPSGDSVEAPAFKAAARSLSTDGAEAVSITAPEATLRERTGRLTRARSLDATLAAVRAAAAAGADVKAGTLTVTDIDGVSYEAANLAATAGSVRLDGVGTLAFKSGAVGWRDAAGRAFEANDVTGTARLARAGRIDDLDVKGARASWREAKRSSPAPALVVEQPSFQTALLAPGTAVEGSAGFVWNKERVAARLKLPPPETLTSAPSFPATVALSTANGTLDFDGNFETGSGVARGRVKAVSPSIEAASRWLQLALPGDVKGPVDITGNVDASATRVALAGGRIVHGTNAVSGDVAVDLAGARPKVTGRLAADRLEADAYLGVAPVKPVAAAAAGQPRPRPSSTPRPVPVEPEVQLSDVFKSYIRAYVDQPVTRSGGGLPDLTSQDLMPAATRAGRKPAITWSTAAIDLSGLRAIDLDIDWSVRQLAVRGLELDVPQLKTHLDDGALTLQGRDVGLQQGRISGEARIDARQPVPAVSANVRGQSVDVLAITEALGLPPLLDGITSIEADVRSAGGSPRQLVEGLTGRVKTDMPQGHVLGYDLGNVNLFSLIRMFSNREFDPERRTAISGLKADLDIERGNVKDSQVSMGGQFLGVEAEGTAQLIEQRVDYRGRMRIASIFRSLPFKLFGDISAPSFQPDLGSIFRSGPGEPTLADIVEASDIKPDAEMTLLIGRALLKATQSGGDQNVLGMLQALQRKAGGN